MIVYPSLLIPAAKNAKMSIPENPDKYDSKENRKAHPHFFVFCVTQLERRMSLDEHWDNAKIIAKISPEKILEVTIADLREMGYRYST